MLQFSVLLRKMYSNIHILCILRLIIKWKVYRHWQNQQQQHKIIKKTEAITTKRQSFLIDQNKYY